MDGSGRSFVTASPQLTVKENNPDKANAPDYRKSPANLPSSQQTAKGVGTGRLDPDRLEVTYLCASDAARTSGWTGLRIAYCALITSGPMLAVSKCRFTARLSGWRKIACITGPRMEGVFAPAPKRPGGVWMLHWPQGLPRKRKRNEHCPENGRCAMAAP